MEKGKGMLLLAPDDFRSLRGTPREPQQASETGGPENPDGPPTGAEAFEDSSRIAAARALSRPPRRGDEAGGSEEPQ